MPKRIVQTCGIDREQILRAMKRLLMHADLQGGAARALSSAVIALEAETRREQSATI